MRRSLFFLSSISFGLHINYTVIHHLKRKRNSFIKRTKTHTNIELEKNNNNKRFPVIKWLCSNALSMVCEPASTAHAFCAALGAHTGRVNLLIEFIKNTYWFDLFVCGDVQHVCIGCTNNGAHSALDIATPLVRLYCDGVNYPWILFTSFWMGAVAVAVTFKLVNYGMFLRKKRISRSLLSLWPLFPIPN